MQANRYAYGNAGPLNNVDLDGHNPFALAGLLFLDATPVGWAVLAAVGVAAVGYVGYKAYQSYEYNRNVANSAGTWDGPVTAASPRATTVPNDYAARAQAGRAAAQQAAQQAATQARISAAVNAMTAAYNKWLAGYLAAARAKAAAEAAARVAAEAKARALIAAQTAAAIKAAQPGPVGTTVVKPPAVVALVGGGAAVANATSTIQVPGAVYAGVDGADAPNAAAAASAAVAATGALEVADAGAGGADPDPGKDKCENDPRKLVEDMAKEVMQDWGTSGLDMRISDAQWRHPEYIWAYRGSEVHKEVASFSRFVRCSFRDADIKGFGDDYLEPGGLRLHKPSHPRW